MVASPLRLDAYTLVFSISILASFMAAVSYSLGNGDPTHRYGFTEWGKSMACVAGGFLLFFLRGHGPWFMTFLVANTLMMAAIPFALLAYARVFEVVAPRQTISIATAIGLSGVLAAYFFDTSRSFAIFTMSFGMAVQLGLMAIMIHQNKHKQALPFAWLSGSAIALLAVACAMRALLALYGDASSVTPAADSLPQKSALFTGGLFIVVSSIGFIAMVNSKQRHEAVDRLRRDGLTGLYTRSALIDMTEEIETFGRTHGYAVIMVDIDHFKAVNDTFGHAGGDLTLAHVARLIANSIRISDIAVRYGGEEFCILLQGCAKSEAVKFAEGLVVDAGLQRVRLRDGRTAQFTLSAGYAYVPAISDEDPVSESLEAVIERADKALYRAKGDGRNQAKAALAPVLFAANSI
jgi:diguanylate cyclase (GGDEF)-like protein